MKALLYKQLRLVCHPMTPVFCLFGIMVIIPNYPYTVIFFYVTLGLFFSFLNMREQLVAMIGRGEDAAACLDMLMIAKYYERIGDHACNIAQWVEYALTGQYEDD